MKKVIQIIIGNVLMAFTVSALILDHSIVAGGVSGISTVFHFYTGISVSLCVAIINIALFLIGLCFFRKDICNENIDFNIFISCFIRVF